jgi:hypothetical protein
VPIEPPAGECDGVTDTGCAWHGGDAWMPPPLAPWRFALPAGSWPRLPAHAANPPAPPRLPPRAEAPPPPPQPLRLTQKELKKLRTQRRQAREKEKQELVRWGAPGGGAPEGRWGGGGRGRGSCGGGRRARAKQELVRWGGKGRGLAHLGSWSGLGAAPPSPAIGRAQRQQQSRWPAPRVDSPAGFFQPTCLPTPANRQGLLEAPKPKVKISNLMPHASCPSTHPPPPHPPQAGPAGGAQAQGQDLQPHARAGRGVGGGPYRGGGRGAAADGGAAGGARRQVRRGPGAGRCRAMARAGARRAELTSSSGRRLPSNTAAAADAAAARNLSRMLTPAEKREKKMRKMFDETGVESLTAVYRWVPGGGVLAWAAGKRTRPLVTLPARLRAAGARPPAPPPKLANPLHPPASLQGGGPVQRPAPLQGGRQRQGEPHVG